MSNDSVASRRNISSMGILGKCQLNQAKSQQILYNIQVLNKIFHLLELSRDHISTKTMGTGKFEIFLSHYITYGRDSCSLSLGKQQESELLGAQVHLTCFFTLQLSVTGLKNAWGRGQKLALALKTQNWALELFREFCCPGPLTDFLLCPFLYEKKGTGRRGQYRLHCY